MKIKGLIIFVFGLLIIGCDKLKEVPLDKFVGIWELKGREMFDGIQIKIEKKDENLTGKIVKLNENKLVNMFADNEDVWVSDISRSSNYQFRLTEKKWLETYFRYMDYLLHKNLRLSSLMTIQSD